MPNSPRAMLERSRLLPLVGCLVCALAGREAGAVAPFDAPWLDVLFDGTTGHVTVADFDEDGRADLAVAGSPKLRVYLGNGNGTFEPGATFAISSVQAVAADVNDDGHLDLLVCPTASNPSASAKLSIFFGRGNGEFYTGPVISLSGQPGPPAVGDLDRDGHADLVVPVVAARRVGIYRGLGAGSFASPTQYTVRVDPLAVAVGDLNRDGAPDVAIWHQGTSLSGGVVSVMLNSGAGTFGARQDIDVGSSSADSYITLADCDAPADLDIVVNGRSTVSVLVNAAGAFTRTDYPFVGVGPAWFGDFNRDGKLDYVASGDTYSGHLYLVYGSVAGGFTPATSLTVQPGARYPVGIDCDGDGWLDIVAPNRSAGEVHILPDRAGVFPAPRGIGIAGEVVEPVLADFDGDGRLDLASITSGADLLTAHGGPDGTFFGVTTRPSGIAAQRLAVGDLDGDGRPDLAVQGTLISPRGAVTAIYNDGGLPTSVGTSRPVGYEPSAVGVVDLDRDGDGDVVELDGDLLEGDYGLGVFRSTGRNLEPGPRYLLDFKPGALFTGDANGDSIPDVVVASATRYRTFLGAGDGSFARVLGGAIASSAFESAAEDPPPPDASPGTLVDVDEDGRADLLVATTTTLRFLRGNGAGGFGLAAVLPTRSTTRQTPVVADFNRDGHLDVLAGLSFYAGRGNGSFRVPFHLGGDDGRGIAAGDVDGDGWDDLVLGGTNPTWFRNLQAAGVSVPMVDAQVPVGGDTLVVGQWTDVRWTSRDATDARVELFVVRGGSRERVAHGLRDTGSFRWRVTGAVTAAARLEVRVRTPEGEEASGLTQAFAIRAPVVSVTYPNGGERLAIGDAVVLRWYSEPIAPATVELQMWRGGRDGYERIAAGVPDTGSFIWTVTTPTSLQTYLGIVVDRGGGFITSAVSEQSFRIEWPPAPPPSVHFEASFDGDTIELGQRIEFRWAITDTSPIRSISLILATGDSAGPRRIVAEHVPNTGSFSWVVDGGAVSTAVFGIVVENAGGGVATAWSPTGLVIVAPPPLLRFFSVSQGLDGIVIRWCVDPTRVSVVEIERNEPPAREWSLLAKQAVASGDTALLVDRQVVPHRLYTYRLVLSTVLGLVLGAGQGVVAEAPVLELSLESIVPNPARGSCRLDFAVPRAMTVRIAVLDLQGREVAELRGGPCEPGRQSIEWRATAGGSRSRPGVYWIALDGEGRHLTKRLVLLAP